MEYNETMDQEILSLALQNTPVSACRAFEETGSTNDVALEWIDCGAGDMALVIADRQTRGKGRLQRTWVTQPGASLAFSLILKPTDTEKATPSALFAPLCGLAVASALENCCHLHPQIKWPNDVLLERQKCCGILVEAAWNGSELAGLVLGIGINIEAASLPAEINTRFPATWLEKHTHQPIDRFELLAAIVNQLAAWREQMGSQFFFAEWSRRLAFCGETVRVEESEKSSIIGTELGVDPEGALLIQSTDGLQHRIEVGDVHLSPTHA
jgi:BirA family biotin operon repressor/biotin-[acetyl-CoA-carboxylase] ligase